MKEILKAKYLSNSDFFLLEQREMIAVVSLVLAKVYIEKLKMHANFGYPTKGAI